MQMTCIHNRNHIVQCCVNFTLNQAENINILEAIVAAHFDTLISDSQVVLEIPMTRNRSLEGSVIDLHLALASAGAE